MNNNQFAGKREQWVDILRGIGICLVLLGHISSPFHNIIYSFHMPMFFLLSGWLWKSKKQGFLTLKSVIKKNFNKYIIPYFILCSINLMLVCTLNLMSHRQLPDVLKYIVGILYSRGTTEWMPNCSPLWYLTAIFIALFFFEIIQQMSSDHLRTVAIIILGLCSALLSYIKMFKLPWNIDTAMMATVFLSIGHCWKEKAVFQKYMKMSHVEQFIIVVMLIAIGCFSAYSNPMKEVNFDNNRYGNVFLMLISSLTLSSAIFLVTLYKQWNGPVAKFFSFLGQHTVVVMGFDYFTGTIALHILEISGISNWMIIFSLKLILVTIICIIWNRIVSLIKCETVKIVLTF